MIGHDTVSAWENFYIIVGSSAGALTGLQFVVMALVAESDASADASEVDAFGTPTIVHFCAVLLVSSIISAPWPQLWELATALEVCGVAGIAYTLIVTRRARRTRNYKPELEDWIWHAVLPLLAYLVLFFAAIVIPLVLVRALFGIAFFALLVLFIGIHNAWDTVTYVTVGIKQQRSPPKTK